MRKAVPLGFRSAYAQCQTNLNTTALKENIVTAKRIPVVATTMLTTVHTKEEHTEYKEEIVINTKQFPNTTHTMRKRGS